MGFVKNCLIAKTEATIKRLKGDPDELFDKLEQFIIDKNLLPYDPKLIADMYLKEKGGFMKQVVRVAIANNFNCTPKEWEQLKKFSLKYPDSVFFTNSNVKTPLLEEIGHIDPFGRPYKAVVTVNPDLIVEERWVKRTLKLADKLAYTRIKWLPKIEPIRLAAVRLFTAGIPVVITLQRFNSLKTLSRYTDASYYQFECTRYRLHGEALREVEEFTDKHFNAGYRVYICDRKGLGCQGCGLCSRLVTGQDLPIKSLSLSSSGLCPYKCPDCYAKAMQNFLQKIGSSPIRFDRIMKNKKQAGATKHIKNMQVQYRSNNTDRQSLRATPKE